MKHLILTLAVFMISLTTVIAQEEAPCDIIPCQDMNPFNKDSIEHYVVSCSGCVIKVIYYYRWDNCQVPPVPDVRIAGYTITDECYDCFDSDWEIFAYAWEQVLRNLPWVGDLDPGDCLEGILGQNESCWWMNIIEESPTHILWEALPCDSSEGCCWYDLVLCKEYNGDTTVFVDSHGGPNPLDCGFELDPDSVWRSCWYACDSVYYYFNTWPPEIIANVKGELKLTGKSKVVPNPNSGNAEIHYESDVTGKINIYIVNSNGELINRKVLSKKNRELLFPFNIEKVAAGVYFYYIKKDGQILTTGKFSIK